MYWNFPNLPECLPIFCTFVRNFVNIKPSVCFLVIPLWVNIARSSNNNLIRGPLLRLATASWTEYEIGELKVRHKQRRQKSDPNQLSRRPDCHGSLDCRNQYLWQGFEACGHLIGGWLRRSRPSALRPPLFSETRHKAVSLLLAL